MGWPGGAQGWGAPRPAQGEGCWVQGPQRSPRWGALGWRGDRGPQQQQVRLLLGTAESQDGREKPQKEDSELRGAECAGESSCGVRGTGETQGLGWRRQWGGWDWRRPTRERPGVSHGSAGPQGRLVGQSRAGTRGSGSRGQRQSKQGRPNFLGQTPPVGCPPRHRTEQCTGTLPAPPDPELAGHRSPPRPRLMVRDTARASSGLRSGRKKPLLPTEAGGP